MHFFYIDESGCNLRDLNNLESPIFILGGLVVSDKGWNKTHSEYEKIITKYFEDSIPFDFELHSAQLLSPNGEGPFLNHDINRRLGLVEEILQLIEDRGHHYSLLPIQKFKLREYDISKIKGKEYVELKLPYLLAYDNMIDSIEEFIKEDRGQSARAMVIIDEKDAIRREIEALTKFRRFNPTISRRVKWISEFSYPVDSKKNSMVQISDLACFIAKKFYGIDCGYHPSYPSEVKTFYRDSYLRIHSRLIKKGYTKTDGRGADTYNTFMNVIVPKLTYGWKTKKY